MKKTNGTISWNKLTERILKLARVRLKAYFSQASKNIIPSSGGKEWALKKGWRLC
jgi:hypothetical protein